jgi:polyferredoxin
MLRAVAGALFAWKAGLLAAILFISIIIYRPFCKYLCPLGAVYALLNRHSMLRYRVDADACKHCGACAKVCGMQLDPSKQPNHPECIRCGECKKACPKEAITSTFAGVPFPAKSHACARSRTAIRPFP